MPDKAEVARVDLKTRPKKPDIMNRVVFWPFRAGSKLGSSPPTGRRTGGGGNVPVERQDGAMIPRKLGDADPTPPLT